MKYTCIFYVLFCFLTSIVANENMDPSVEHSNVVSVREYINLGREKVKNSEFEEAAQYYQKALALEPNCADIYFYLGNLAFQQNDIATAKIYYKKAASLCPNSTDIYCNLGICSNVNDAEKSSIKYFSKALTIDPDCRVAHLQLGILFEKQKKYDEALKYLKRAYELDPANIELLTHIGDTLRNMDKFDEAVFYFRTYYAQKPDDLRAILELANVLNMVDENEESLNLYYKAIEKKPDLTTALYNFGFTLKKLGYVEQAISIFKKSIIQRPDYALAHFSLALAYLSIGDFDRGWLEYEWRWAAYDEKPISFPQPRWDGSDIRDKRIYIYAEQGFGDTFQFIRYLKLIKEKGAYVIFKTQSPLKAIMQLCPYIDEIVTYKDPLPFFDCHIPLMSLPLVFNTTADTIPVDIPYLFADEALVEEWHEKLIHDPHFKIGICWQGNAEYETPILRRTVAAKSCHLSFFKELFSIPGISLYSLQKMYGLDQIALLTPDAPIRVFNTNFDDSHGRFMDTAAVIKNIDLIITIDTSIGHFAAALGARTWILLPEPADWRWMYTTKDTPWYPNVRLFRQSKRNDWESVMRDVKNALSELLCKQSNVGKSIVRQGLYITSHDSAITQRLHRYISSLIGNSEHDYAKLSVAYALQHDLANVEII